ncbi:MAG: transposase [Rubrivivax sp.]|nr:transposase [Rubrivivax sp.]
MQAIGRQPQRAPDGAPLHYERHRPEQTTLYRLVQQHAASFIAHTEASTAAELPRFIKDEFDAFLECGILAHGFLWLRCGECGHDKLLANSRKRRGLCPSCGARRMSQTAARLVGHVIPHVPVRQWVLSLPIPLRVLLAAQPELVTPVLQVVQRVITRHLLDDAELRAEEGHSGAVTLIQRLGSAANLNIHLHCLVLDGVYRCDADGAPSFIEAGAPTDEELHALLQTAITRLMKMLTRQGVLVEELVEDMDQTYLAEPDADSEEAHTLRPLQAAAITYRIAFGPRAGQKVLTLRGAMPREDWVRQALCADTDGFSLHAAVRVQAHDRKRLEQLCRYITRPALSDERVQLNAAGQVELKLKTPWRDGTTHLVMSPLEFMQRLAALVPALVPRPRLHLIRFHGVLAPNAKLRSLVVPKGPPVQEEPAAEAASAAECEVQNVQARPHHISWARLLKRVFDIDMQRCPNCGGGELKIIAAIVERPVIEKILTHLGLDPQPPPRGRAREVGQD